MSFITLKFAAPAALLMAALGPADAAVIYNGTRTIGDGSANLSITTDGTIGVLDEINILDWTIDLINLDGTFTLTSANSQVRIDGSALSATASDLLFDFDGTELSFALFQAPFVGSSRTFYCVQTSGCFDPELLAGEAVEATADLDFPLAARSGVVSIASSGNETPAVPEPATWAMMIAGFGVVGAAMRRRPTVTLSWR